MKYDDYKKSVLECTTLPNLHQIEQNIYNSNLSDDEKTDLSFYLRARIGHIET